ncbi:DNA repair protein RadA [Deinococcus sp.]|uniref:DNA repair protein RadA n=1 Tax=Deinococcus sp. TaxID=47478 RepID=UPI003CC56B90
MPRATTRYVCNSCGYVSAKSLGRCPTCQAWNSFEEEVASTVTAGKGGYGGIKGGKLTPLSAVGRREEPRLPSGIPEFDRVLGGGLVAGGVTLIGGEPGIGKSTLLLQVADLMARQGSSVLYVAGEESLEQIRLRADRLGVQGEIELTRDTRAEAIAALMEAHRPALCIVDSIQTVTQVDSAGVAGGVSQVRDATALITRAAKETGTATVLVGHVTKDGNVAGPKVMEHIVDTTVFLESVGSFRLLRSVKNRFGQAGELGVFEMQGSGLVAVENPSAAFLAERPVGVPGSVVAATQDGHRPMLLEVQALAARTPYPNPRRVVVGLDPRRVDVVLAVLERRLNLTLGNLDIYVNLAGGLKVPDPGLDLAVALAVYSAVVGKALPANVAVFGEVGLAGEVRTVQGAIRRAEEARRAGYTRLVVPPGLDGQAGGARSVEEALGVVWQGAGRAESRAGA